MKNTTAIKPQMDAVQRRCCSGTSAKRRPVLRWATAPQGTLPGAPAVQGVALAPGEDVARTLTTKGTAGWETTGIAFLNADTTTLLLKRPR